MPNLTIPISRVPPSGRAAVAGPSRATVRDMERAAREEDRARATVGRGIQQLGAGISAIGDELYEQTIGDQYLKAKIEYITAGQKFIADMENKEWAPNGIPQWPTAQEQWDAHQKKTIEEISNELFPEAKEKFKEFALLKKLSGDEVVRDKIGLIRNNYLLQTLPLAIGRIARSGDWEEANRLLNEFKANILATGAIPESQLLQFNKIFDKNVVRGAVGNRLPDKYIEQLIKEADSLTTDEKNSLRNFAKAAIASRQREEKAALKAKQDETASNMLLKLLRNELTYDEVEKALENNWLTDSQTKSLWTSLLDPTVPKTDYLKALENVNKAISDYRRDPEKKREAIDAIYDNLGNISRANSEQLLKTIEEMSKPDSALNRPAAKRAFQVLNELKQERLWLSKEAREEGYTPEDDRLNKLKWMEISNNFEQWLLSEERTDNEIEEKLKGITEPAAEEITLNWLERLMWTKRPQLFGLVGTQAERLVEKKVKELQELDKWAGLTAGEQETIRQAFRMGRTVKDVVNLMK